MSFLSENTFSVSKKYIDRLMATVEIKTVKIARVPVIVGIAHIGTWTICSDFSAAADPRNFSVTIGEEYVTKRLLVLAEESLWKQEAIKLSQILDEFSGTKQEFIDRYGDRFVVKPMDPF